MTLAAMLMTMSLMAQGTYDAAPTAHKPVVQKSQYLLMKIVMT